MSAKDKYHDTVVCALQKDSWHILGEQQRLLVDKRTVWIDIRASKEAPANIIFVEVKNYENVASPVAYLESVLGQYLLYRAIIKSSNRDEELYLALPEQAFDGIFGEELGKLVISYYSLKIIMFNIQKESIIRWIT
ncbi:MAG: element excision factor XisH family protein [Anaerolineae bacterium]|nr:element excision factor XisH family protein [Anaerolineae bacterium]MDQ7033295.1 element excision factor XisH family protein [Anaerolineae bacterium]